MAIAYVKVIKQVWHYTEVVLMLWKPMEAN